MTYKDVKDMVAGIGLPYAYRQFPEHTGQACPFLCWFFTSSNDLAAENTNWQKIRTLAIELYTDAKDFLLEERIEDALNAAGLVYYREESWLDSEKMNMVSYETDILITKET